MTRSKSLEIKNIKIGKILLGFETLSKRQFQAEKFNFILRILGKVQLET